MSPVANFTNTERYTDYSSLVDNSTLANGMSYFIQRLVVFTTNNVYPDHLCIVMAACKDCNNQREINTFPVNTLFPGMQKQIQHKRKSTLCLQF